VKTRNDFQYGPGQFLKPCLLAGLQNDTVLINDKEMHTLDRWGERGHHDLADERHLSLPPDTPWHAQQTLPLMTSDQFMVGTRHTMDTMLNIASYPPNDISNCSKGNAFWEWAGRSYPGA
jgi:hypothetical protein